MDEQTGTADELIFESSDVESVANEPTTEQDSETSNGSAVEATNEQSDSQVGNSEESNSTPSEDNSDINDFLAKKGIKRDDPDAFDKVAKMYLNSEKLALGKAQQTAQLQRQLAKQQTQQSLPDQQALSEVRAMRIEMDAKEWKNSHNLTAEDEQKMVEYLSQPLTDRQGNVVVNPLTGTPYTRGTQVNNGLLSLDDVYQLAGCGAQDRVDSLKADLRKEIEAEMAARQAAKRPSSNATNSTQFGKAETEDPFLSGLFG